MKNYKEQLKNITTFIFDYDGVMTSGDVLVDANGVPLRSTNVKDGYALQLAARLGYNIAIITGGYSISIEKRMEMKMFSFALQVRWKSFKNTWKPRI